MSESAFSRLPVSPDVYVQKIDVVRESALLIVLDEQSYRNASFLDDRVLAPRINGMWSPLAAVSEAADRTSGLRPLHFIFHTGHVGSTLVSRLLDEFGCVLSLREPLPLRTLAECRDVLALPESLLSAENFAALQGALLRLWRRGYNHTHSVVLKATSSACRMAPSLLDGSPESRGVYLNVSAPTYLATLLAGANSPTDLRGHGAARIRQLQARLKAPLPSLHAISLGELAALSWLAETWNQIETCSRYAARVIAIDFDDFLANVPAGLGRIASHFNLPFQPLRLDEIARSPVLAHYSKSPEFEYSPQLRTQVLEQAKRQHAGQIGQGLRWLDNLAGLQPAVRDILRAASGSR